MKKNSIAQYLFIGMTPFLFMACSQEEETVQPDERVPLKVMVNTGESSQTRASLSGLATTFESGDMIGIFVANADKSPYYNIPFVFDGSNWTLATGEYIPEKVSFLSECEYFAYYPYTESLDGWPYYEDTDQDGVCSAEEFFENVISSWTPQMDQSTKASFNASDLMVGKGTIVSAASGTVSFSLRHKMGLIKFELYNGNGGLIPDISASSTELFTADSRIPFKLGYEFYYIAKPNELFSLLFNPPVEYLEEQVDTVTPRPGRLSRLEFTVN